MTTRMNSIDPAAAPPESNLAHSDTNRSSSRLSSQQQPPRQSTATASSSSQQFNATSPYNRKGAATRHVKHDEKQSSHHPADRAMSQDDGEAAYPLFDDDRPWSQRSWAYELLPFRGMWYDLRRRAPFVKSDWTSALEPRNWFTIASSVIRMYFINLMPAIAYVLDMNYRTNGSYGINEVILASALAAIVFPIFSVQPLTFVGVTGLINLVNYTQYNIFVGYYGFDNISYLRIQAWSLIWSAGFHFLIAIFNICDFTRFITDITSQTFGFYVGIVYIQKGIELLLEEFEPAPLDNATGWLSVTIAILFTVSVYLVSKVGNSSYLPFRIRNFIAGYAFAAGCVFWTGFSHFPDSSLRRVPIERLPITRSWFPTMDRSWFIDFWNIEFKYVFVGAPLGFLITILFYFDHNVSSVMAQARNFPVKRPAGFHWDFFLLGVTTLVSGFLGLPAPNGLVPQAPVHTESLSVYKQVDKPDEEKRIALEAKGKKNNTIKQQHVINSRVIEQRFSHLVVGLLTLGTMTRPLLVALGTMPRAVFAGVFILVGWSSIERNHITMRTLAIFRDRRMSPPDEPLSQIRRSKIALFVGIQWVFFAMTIAISQTIAGIGFPVIITALIPFRYYVVPKWFSPLELKALDAPTADADVVLASLGHEPERVTGRGVEIAVDTGIASDLYDGGKKHDGDNDDDYQPGANSASNDKTRAVDTDSQDASTLRRGQSEKAPEPQEDATKTVAGLGGQRTADPEDHLAPAIGGGILAAGFGTGASAAVADEKEEETEEQAESKDIDTASPANNVFLAQQQHEDEKAKQEAEAEKRKKKAVLLAKQKQEDARKKEEKKAKKQAKEDKKREKEEDKTRKKEAAKQEAAEQKKQAAEQEKKAKEEELKKKTEAAAAAAVGIGAGAVAASDSKQEEEAPPRISTSVLALPEQDGKPRLSTSSSIRRKPVAALESTDEQTQTEPDPTQKEETAEVVVASPASPTLYQDEGAALATSPVTGKGSRHRRRIISVENPIRGPGSPPPPVQWQGTTEA